MTLLSKIHAVRKLGLAVVKTGEITGKNKITFASYADVWETLKPALDEQDLSVGFTAGTVQPHGDGDRAALRMVVSDGTEREETEYEMLLPEKIVNQYGSSVTNSGQRNAGAFSFIRRNALLCFFNIGTGDADAVERMNPEGNQSNIPGIIRVNERTAWQDLTDGGWSNAESPLHDGTLAQYGGDRNRMVLLWSDYPAHAGITAWAADWINDALQQLGMSWADVMEREPDLPGSITQCDGAAMRRAASVVRQVQREIGEGGQGA